MEAGLGVRLPRVQRLGQNGPVVPPPQEKVSRLEAELDEERSTVELLTDRMTRGRDQVTPSLPRICVSPEDGAPGPSRKQLRGPTKTCRAVSGCPV